MISKANTLPALKYLSAYPEHIQARVSQLIAKNELGPLLAQRYPHKHQVQTDKALYDYVTEIKQEFFRNSAAIAKVAFDSKIKVIQHALGTHTQISRIQGGKLKSKHEIRIASLFKNTAPEFLKMIVTHELAHLKEKDHNKAFYQLCQHIEPNYMQLEFDLRLYLTHQDLNSSSTDNY
ncbi:M48 family metallopeptidase [Deefgea rivuli]|uniref:M48 family metallopeptidase n=1 Tax=Deefgea rivuli TaxID=400948 RepID=UPI000567FC23|nr:M48 family metallopeptidase [Deefgea rivuli]